jgi:hypothetical protein
MTTPSLELRPIMAPYDWQQPEWQNKERVVLRALAREAGWRAYQGVAWSNEAIRHEALRFLAQSELLHHLLPNQVMTGGLILAFTQGWRKREKADMHAPREELER